MIRVLGPLSLLACLAAAAPADELTFMQGRLARQFDRVPRKVLAFYYTWYGTPEQFGRWSHWENRDVANHQIGSSTHFPRLGAYDSLDPRVIAQHLDWAKAAGLTGLICTWWAQGDIHDQALPLVLDAAAERGLEVSIYLETTTRTQRTKVQSAVSDLTYVLTRYGRHKAFLKVDGKPVIFVYGRVMGEVPTADWQPILEVVQDIAGDAVYLADGYRDSFAYLFDGLHTYNIAGALRNAGVEQVREYGAKAFPSAVAMARRRHRISCVTIIPGYDDTKIRKPGLAAPRNDGQTYRINWEQAIAADPDWILITSFNEWHEGSEIEPSYEDGRKYLDITAEYAPKFTALPPVSVPAVPAGALPADRAAALRQRFANRTIGILPGFSSNLVFWLLDAGVRLRVLQPAELLDPQVMDPATMPVLLNASGEEYLDTVREPGDAVAAIVRWQQRGGLLISATSLPYPFHHTVDGQGGTKAAQVGLMVQQGWEEPPARATLTFRTNAEALPRLAATAPFPTSGDRRWRPSVAGVAKAGDTYLPLVTLADGEGKTYGDGVAYWRRGQAKSLYVWMRMGEAYGANELYEAIMLFAADHL